MPNEQQQMNVPFSVTTSLLTLRDHLDHILARWAINRSGHRVEPGIYALGHPTSESPVLVTANYTLSFDALRSALAGFDAFILVLDTKGVNVWCAAGKGTFGTDELSRRIETTRLSELVSHRTLILPQLGGAGVAAHEIRKRTGFKVEYGPVRATDLPHYLRTQEVTPEMRRVMFTLLDRIILIPVELVFVLIPLLLVGVVLRSLPAVMAILAGTALFPILLPWLPTANFSTKGYLLGILVFLPFLIADILHPEQTAWWHQAGDMLAGLLVFPPITAYLALNFTGSSTYTSRSGVRNEMFAYLAPMAWMFGMGCILMVALFFVKG